MVSKKKILVAVAWPYVNGPMHLGHFAGAYLSSDIFARYHRLKGNDVLMVSGSDMHGTPTAVKAEQEKVKPIELAEKYHKIWQEIFTKTGISFDLYTKTSTDNHKKKVQEIFLVWLKEGYIYKDTMLQSYCEFDKRFLPDRFVDGTCPYCSFTKARGDQCDNCGRTLDPKDLIDPTCKTCKRRPVEKETEHFFFDLPKFSTKLEEYLSKQKHWRANPREFALSWIREGLKSRPITRDMDYGIPVPVEGFEGKVIYVWFEALLGYLTASIEWADKTGNSYLEYWKNSDAKHYYFMGKDNIPFHTIILPAILMAYDKELNLPYDIVASENLNLEGEKLSKSTGNYIEVDYVASKYSVDQLRYYLISISPETKDCDFIWKDFITSINSELVGTLGNLINRTYVFIKNNFNSTLPEGTLDPEVERKMNEIMEKTGNFIEDVRFQQALSSVMELAKYGNKYFDEKKPWINPLESGNTLFNMIQIISALSILLSPFIPNTAKKIEKMLDIYNTNWTITKIPSGTKLGSTDLLFTKVEKSEIATEEANLKKLRASINQ